MRSLIQLAVIVLMLVSMWKVYEKMGRQGWEGIIPIYNWYVLLPLVGKPVWWLILFFIPVVNVIIAILVCIAWAERFGKTPLFGVGMAILGFIFIPILAFGSDQFQGAPPMNPAAPNM